MSLTSQTEDLLQLYEGIAKKIATHRTRHADVLDVFETLQRESERVHAELKKLYSAFAGKGPPPEVPPDVKTFAFARGPMFEVSVTFRRSHDRYDPSRLPDAVLVTPGVVVDVDPAIVEGLSSRYPSIAKALIAGDWLTPTVQLKPRTS